MEKCMGRTWVHKRRGYQDFLNKPEIKALPKPIQKKLTDFIYTEIPNTRFFKPDGNPKKEWKIFYADTWGAAWGAARYAARGAAWGAAWGAARDAARDAARYATRDAAWGAAWDAAWGAARDAAWGAARDAAWGAARDATLISDYIITSDLKVKDREKHLAHTKARWEVWQKGYGLLCDVDGVLYVYAVEKPKPPKPLSNKEANAKLSRFAKAMVRFRIMIGD
jgi:hypothetical protein